MKQLNNAYFNNQQYYYRSLALESLKPNMCEQNYNECSVITSNLYATEPGDYDVDPNWLLDPSQQAVSIRMNVKLLGRFEAGGGAYVQDDYRPVSGKIRVTRDASGVFHYDSIGAITVQRLSATDGAPNAPSTLRFTLVNGY